MAVPIRLTSAQDMADALGIPKSVLMRYVFLADRHYKDFKVAKRSGRGWRAVSAPSPALKGIQRWILYFILRPQDLSDVCTGFRLGFSIASNAAFHVGREFVANADVLDFFPSITAPTVFGLFRQLGYPDDVCFVLTRLCTHKGRLPQGSPASPDIANLIARKLDNRLSSICKIRHWSFSRYADDITISGSGSGEQAIKLIEHVAAEEGFTLNPRKSHVARRGDCQIVTGLVVNDRVGVPRHFRRRLRAAIHQLQLGTASALADESGIRGRISFLAMIDPSSPLVKHGRQVLADLEKSRPL